MTSRGFAPAGTGASPWVVRFRPRLAPRLRLFCLPFAGAGASAYATWPAGLPDEIEICAVQLPGREGRFNDPLVTDIHALVPALCDGIAPLLDRPFALFGHSMGAAVAYETARALARDRGRSPAVLFVSGHRAPHLPRQYPPIHHLPDPEFVDELRRLNGTPAEVLAGSELLDLVLPLLRADFQMAETYVPSPGGPLACRVVALGSTEDDRVSLATLEPWREATTGPFEVAMFPGDHFYLKTHRVRLLDFLATTLRPLLR
jgi:surfactin synthase thioesterase subunit